MTYDKCHYESTWIEYLQVGWCIVERPKAKTLMRQALHGSNSSRKRIILILKERVVPADRSVDEKQRILSPPTIRCRLETRDSFSRPACNLVSLFVDFSC